MQGKEASETRAAVKSNVGIDVSKDWLDVHVVPCGERLRAANTNEGLRRLKRWLKRFDIALVVMEATGKWHRLAWRSLAAGAIPVAVIDPFKARMFAKAHDILAKTDRLDAAMLAGFAAVMTPPVRPPPAEVLCEIGELVTARHAAVGEETSLKNQHHSAQTAVLRRQLTRRIARLGKDIAELEAALMARIKADPHLARRHAILTSIPSFGTTVAVALIAGLAELGQCGDKTITALAGLAPIADQSGQRDGKRSVFAGRAQVRRILYLAALSASRYNSAMAEFYRRLRSAGKPPKLALVAVARKLLLLANTLIANDRLWQKEAPKHA